MAPSHGCQETHERPANPSSSSERRTDFGLRVPDVLDTTWLWSPYDYGEGSIDHNHAADPKEEYARMSLDVDTAFKVDFGWPVAADNTDRIPED